MAIISLCNIILSLISLLEVVHSSPQISVLQTRSAATSAPSAGPIGQGRGTTLTTQEKDELFTLHEQLVNIPSISGEETECADFIVEHLTDLGYYVERIPVGNTGTFNVFAYPQKLKDESNWPEVLITSHIDTVSNWSATCLAFIASRQLILLPGSAVLSI